MTPDKKVVKKLSSLDPVDKRMRGWRYHSLLRLAGFGKLDHSDQLRGQKRSFSA